MKLANIVGLIEDISEDYFAAQYHAGIEVDLYIAIKHPRKSNITLKPYQRELLEYLLSEGLWFDWHAWFGIIFVPLEVWLKERKKHLKRVLQVKK